MLPEQKVSLAANEAYWGGKPALDGIERLVIGDALTRLSKFKNGEVDMVNLERQDVDGLKNSEFKDQLVYLDRPAIWYVAMNQLQYEPFKKKEVRQAFAMSINRERIVNEILGGINQDEILGGINQVANGIVPPGVPGHRENAKVLPFDPAKAKEMLAAAGYPDPSKMPALTLTFRDERPDIRRAAEAVATDIKTNLGVDVKLQAMEWGASGHGVGRLPRQAQQEGAGVLSHALGGGLPGPAELPQPHAGHQCAGKQAGLQQSGVRPAHRPR